MKSAMLNRFIVAVYMVSFFTFLLGPLAVMVVSAFNTPAYPQVWPIEGLTLEWFQRLASDAEILEGLKTSVIIGIFVVLVSVPVGLAGAICMTQIFRSARSFYYFVVVAPVLTPGIVIGISTVVFWRDFSGLAGLRELMYDGIVLTVLGQSSFISSYCMLIIMARLQRFESAQEEAALDLGASFPQAFRHILLPFLRPAILSAAVLAFLTSFENYNTTTFSILADKTLTTVLAGRVRLGSSPVISALATIIVMLTLVAALAYELIKRREDRRNARRKKTAMAAEDAELSPGAPRPAPKSTDTPPLRPSPSPRNAIHVSSR
ncbi:ABC transporter permease [Halotalea alkalilenta]|uniref:ABC transporter permease n=1 Tax=Halotalea alkalilenta TaxID=376489 RepID=UPI0009DE9DFB|nr:ABC transporter permease [Halotalea alkalilenta]